MFNDFQGEQLVCQQLHGPTVKTRGGFATSKRHEKRFLFAIELVRCARPRVFLQRPRQSTDDEFLARSFNRGNTGLERLGDFCIRILFMRQPQNVRAPQLADRNAAFLSQGINRRRFFSG